MRPLSVFAISLWCVVVGFMASGQVYAQSPCLNYAAISLEPSLPSIQAGAYFQLAGRVTYKGTSTAKITLFGPIFNNSGKPIPRWNSFTMFYQDSDGTGNTASVGASLGYLDPAGNVKNVALLDSNQHFPSGTGVREMSTLFTHTFDFVNNYYYIQVGLNRTTTTSAPAILGIKICEAP